VNGLVVPPDEVSMFADALTALAADPRWRASCGIASRRLVGRFTIDAMVEATLLAYVDPAPVPHLAVPGHTAPDRVLQPVAG
jgi:hypothetical protein